MKIALVGNQNSGKTTLFNKLTGMNAKIGNWPGVTIEKKVGQIEGTEHQIVDLPGIYSLSPYSTEEEVSRKFIFEENPEVIINIIDSTSLERSLYLTTQLLELDARVIIALNMADILEKNGIKIDIENLEKMLGAKVIKISALKGTGINALVEEIDNNQSRAKIKIYDNEIEEAIAKIQDGLPHKRFTAVNILQNDARFNFEQNENIEKIEKDLSKKYDTDLEETIAIQRYRYIEKVKEATVIFQNKGKNISDTLDSILLNKWLAFPIFAIIMLGIYYLSVGVIGKLTVDIVENFIDNFKVNTEVFLNDVGISQVIISLLTDGIIAGVGSVLSFVPQLIILFLCISVLETTGYMSRIALLLDKVFRKIGLSGKSLIPFILGSGCSVPGIMGTRIIENNDEREMTAILTPFIPCSAKLPIIALFSGYFFKENAGIVSASLYVFAICIIIVSAFVMKKFVYKNTSSTFISELPKYKFPNVKYVAQDVFDKTTSFVRRAGSIILLCSVIIWFLLSFSVNLQYGVDIENSILATIGNKISWMFVPILGEDSWGATVSAIQGLVAKEQVISSMSVIAGFSEDLQENGKMFSDGSMFSFFTPASAYSFMVFNLFSAPCFGAIAAMKRELGSVKKVLKTVIFQFSVAWCLATLVFQLASQFERGYMNLPFCLTALLLLFAFLHSCFFHNINSTPSFCCNDCNSCKK